MLRREFAVTWRDASGQRYSHLLYAVNLLQLVLLLREGGYLRPASTDVWVQDGGKMYRFLPGEGFRRSDQLERYVSFTSRAA